MKCIIFQNNEGGISIISPILDDEFSAGELDKNNVPTGAIYSAIDMAYVPSDKTFRAAWEVDFTTFEPMRIIINMDKAKTIGHEIRRAKRADEFAPLDEQIMKQIPGTDPTAVEAERQVIRDKYAVVQTQIDAVTTPDEIKTALGI